MEGDHGPRPAVIVGTVLGFAALGTPLFLYVWETLNGLLSGHGSLGRAALAVPALALLAVLLWLLARLLRGWGPS
jgi:hypothetical protein